MDSATSTDSLYSSLASSCRRKWVDFRTLWRGSRVAGEGGGGGQTGSDGGGGQTGSDGYRAHSHTHTVKILLSFGPEGLTCSTGSTAPGWRSRRGSASRSCRGRKVRLFRVQQLDAVTLHSFIHSSVQINPRDVSHPLPLSRWMMTVSFPNFSNVS